MGAAEQYSDDEIAYSLLQYYKQGQIQVTDSPQGSGGSVYQSQAGTLKQNTPSMEQLKLLLDDDEGTVPEKLKGHEGFWALNSKHTQLTHVPGQKDIFTHRRQIRDLIRVGSWSRHLRGEPYHSLRQQEYYTSFIKIPKSLYQNERRLIATQIIEDGTREGDKTPMADKGGAGLISRVLGGVFGKGR